MKFSKTRLVANLFLPLLLAACATTQPPGSSPALNSTAWVLADLPGQTIPSNEAPATMRFEEARVQGSDGCNRYMAKYSQAGSSLNIDSQIAGTQMACPGDRMARAHAFLNAVRQTRTFRIDDGKLLLLGASGSTLASLSPQRQDLAGSAWQVTGYNNGRQAVVSVLRDSELTLAFAAEGKVSGTSGCNHYTGAYASSRTRITVSSLASTRRMCVRPEGVMEQESQFLKALESVASARFEGARLELRTADDKLAVILTAE